MIVNYLSLLERKYQCNLDPTAQEYIHHAVEGGMRMHQLIDDLLLYSRVNTGNKDFSLIDMNAVITKALTFLEVPIVENKVEIVVDNLPTILGNESQMVQVMQNLIGNAIKFHGPAVPKVEIVATSCDEGWTFAVIDNGIGLDMNYSDKIFMIFQRLHTKEDYPGTGVGLALVKKIDRTSWGSYMGRVGTMQGSDVLFHHPRDIK